jgi:hypothetical protein
MSAFVIVLCGEAAYTVAEPPGATAAEKSPPWAGNRVGVSDEVLRPWTSVEAAANRVSVWGRSYRFECLPLPASVVARGAEVLAGPITLSGSADGKPLAWRNSSCRIVQSKPNAAELATRAESGQLVCEGKVAVEYDGMIRCDLQLVPKSGKVTVDRLALEIPLRAEHALFLHTWPGGWGTAANSRALGKTGHQGPFKPFVWLGDHARGLAWFAESDRNFFVEPSDRVLDIRPAGDTVLWRVNLISKPLSIDRPLDYTFGFQATPVKPESPDAWDHRIVHMGDYGLEDRPSAESATLSYPATGQWDLKRGTFECWVRPNFDPQPKVDPDDPGRGSLNRNLLDVELPGGRVGFYWNVDDRGMRVYYKQGDSHPLVFGSPADWQRGQWRHVAFTWGDATRIFLDGKKVAEHKFQGSISGDLRQARIVFGQSPCEMEIDEVRISSVPRDSFDLSKPPQADATTLVLDHLDESFAPDGARSTQPTKGTGGVARGGTFVLGRFGRGFRLQDSSGKSRTLLDQLAEAGVRTICFHEHWTDIQNYPRTIRGEGLHKLVRACHERNIQLLVYFGYLMSDIAPEWNRYHEACLVAPRTGDYKRNPPQTAYMVCYKSHWQDFLAQGIDRVLDEYKLDGVYLDGTSEPWECANRLHGCGYTRPDGKTGTTYSFFATRQMMRRIYTIVKHRNPQGQVNVHQSTCMTIPTLAFATSYWDGEQLQGVKRSDLPLSVLPLDAFCAEFMGHNWGVPAELLWYDGGPFRRVEAVGLGLLHDIPTRPGSMADVDVSSRLWRTRDAFGCKDATWIPYWESEKCLRANPPGVKVSLHHRPGKGVLAVIFNTAGQKCRAEVALDLAALRQPAGLAAVDVLSGKPVEHQKGKLAVPLGPMEYAVIRLKAP